MQSARDVCGFSLKVEVECSTEEQADEAVNAGADIVMLDNFSPTALRELLQRRRTSWRSDVKFEASGGITIDNIKEYFCAGCM